MENRFNRTGCTARAKAGIGGYGGHSIDGYSQGGCGGHGIADAAGIAGVTGVDGLVGLASLTGTQNRGLAYGLGIASAIKEQVETDAGDAGHNAVAADPAGHDVTQPWTAFEILTKRGCIDVAGAINSYLETNQTEIQDLGILKDSAVIRLASYKYQVTRSRFRQPTDQTIVDFIVSAKLTGEKYRKAYVDFRLRCMLDLRVCSQRVYGPFVILEKLFKKEFSDDYPIATNDYLLPILFSKDYETIAHDMLRQYFPEIRTAIGNKTIGSASIGNTAGASTGKNAAGVGAEELARRMGLEIYDVHFADPSIMGQIYYDFGEVGLLDADGKPYKALIGPGKILISLDNCYTEAIRNSTIAHECCHMYLDRWFFLLQMMTGKPHAAYTSRKKDRRRDTEYYRYHKNTPMDWMELQCEKLPAHLLLESEETKAFIDVQLKSDKSRDRLQHVIQALAARYKVSRSMAKYRMNELGYTSVEGISCYVNNRKVPDHSCSGLWPEGVTFTVSSLDVVAICTESSKISEKLRSGQYVYVEGHICVNSKKYLLHDRQGRVYMTSYAREHIDECCLGFQSKGRFANSSFSAGVAHRNATDPVTDKYLPSYKLASEPGCEAYDKENAIFADDTFLWGSVSTELRHNPEINTDFDRAVKYLMEIKKITVENMSGDMDIDRKTLYNARTNRRPKLGEVIAICVALKLPYYISEDLMEIARCRLLNTPEDMLYRAFLLSAEKLEISRCNDILVEHGFDPLIGGKKKRSE